MAATVWDSSKKSSNITLDIGDTRATTTSNSYDSVLATNGKNTGKLYFEVYIGTSTGIDFIGVCDSSQDVNSSITGATAWSFYIASGYAYNNTSYIETGLTSTSSCYVQVAVDLYNGRIWWGIDNVWDGNPSAGTGYRYSNLSGTLYPALTLYTNTNSGIGAWSSDDFNYSPPSGFAAWDVFAPDAASHVTTSSQPLLAADPASFTPNNSIHAVVSPNAPLGWPLDVNNANHTTTSNQPTFVINIAANNTSHLQTATQALPYYGLTANSATHALSSTRPDIPLPIVAYTAYDGDAEFDNWEIEANPGAIGDVEFLEWDLSADADTGLIATGHVAFPIPTATASSGAIASVSFPAFSCDSIAINGGTAVGVIVFPTQSVSAIAYAEIVATTGIDFHQFRVSSEAVSGLIVNGDVDFYSWRVESQGIAGHIANSSVNFPAWTVSTVGFEDIAANGEIEFPMWNYDPWAIRALTESAQTNRFSGYILRYDPWSILR